jgi:hypothetical protein
MIQECRQEDESNSPVRAAVRVLRFRRLLLDGYAGASSRAGSAVIFSDRPKGGGHASPEAASKEEEEPVCT